MGFSQEMRDFLSAYNVGSQINTRNVSSEHTGAQTEALTKKTAHDYDPSRVKVVDDTASANLDRIRAATRASGTSEALTRANINSRGVSDEYTRALTERLRQQQQAVPGSGLLPPGMGLPQQGAVPLQSTIQYAEGGAVRPRDMVMRGRTMLEKDRDDSTRLAARVRAGMELPEPTRRGELEFLRRPIERYAAGGMVDPDNDPLAEPDADADDQPVTGPLAHGAVGDTDFSARRRQMTGQPPSADPHQVVKEAYKYGMNAFGLQGTGAVRSPQHSARVKQLAAGAGALSPEEMEAARKAIDPDGKMPEGVRNMAALGAVYQFWANKNEPEKAQKVAFQMLQHYRLASERYAAIAAHAAQQGNVDLATKAALKAYANVPDGRDMTIRPTPDGKLEYIYTDENGEVLKKGIATPQQLADSAMGLASGGFDRAILSAAGGREKATGAGGQGAVKAGGGPRKALDETAAGNLEAAIKADQEKAAKNKGAEGNEEFWGTLRETATHVQQSNPGATASEVLRATKMLIQPSKKNEEPYKVTEVDGGYSVKFDSGHRVQLDPDTFDVIMNQRAAYRKQMWDKQDADAAEAAKPNRYLEGAKKIGAGVAGAVGDFVSSRVPDELKQRVGADLSNAKYLVPSPSEVLDKFRGRGAVPVSPK